ncbi:alpha-amylase family protein [Streptomyces sp. NPDC047002]|uniref:alpha-amylase family protein n=1 Tax=Streptomyces sp. NPDC047002 TaxID=3155475 RepID=UPI003451DE9F
MRQIHLDFHTSEHLPDVAGRFDAEAFAGTLARAHVDSVICFARCHHGWVYYRSADLADRVHPQLRADLLEEQIRACRDAGIRVPVYTTVQWDDLTCTAHPEWRIQHADGSLEGTSPFEAGFYRKLCLNSPFRQFMRDHVREILTTVGGDGLYLDFIRPDVCVCAHCRRLMEETGLDPERPADREEFGVSTVNAFEAEMTAYARSLAPGCPVTYNGGHIGMRHRGIAGAYTHFELETLPSGGWGYQYFPVTARYARTLGPAVVGTTGKFHSTWGDFHSLKNKAALEYECYRMLAMAAGCSIGDQLHPSGVLDPDAYRLIGDVYAEVERKEPWCRGAVPVTEIAVLHPEEVLGGGVMQLPPAVQGVTRMLEEGGHQFDLVDSHADFGRYRMLVLPDHIRTGPRVAEKIERFTAAGGALVATFESGMTPDGSAFALPSLGVTARGPGETDAEGRPVRGRAFPRNDHTDYVRPGEALAGRVPRTEHTTYARGVDISADDGTDVLADTVAPYFDRHWRHYTSHLQAPSSGRLRGPAATRRGNAVYFAHPLFTQYERNAPLWMKHLFLDAVDLLLPEPLLRHDGPSTLRATVNAQPEEGRQVVHLLHYVPERRGSAFDTVEDVIPLHGLTVSLRTPGAVRAVTSVPDGTPLPHHTADGRTRIAVDRVDGHRMICVETS